MKRSIITFLLAGIIFPVFSQDFAIEKVEVLKDNDLNQMVFSVEVRGVAGDSVPNAIGMLDGAPVLGYVFPTTLKSYDVGFDTTAGIVALALTSHPDFDDTPLWDENADKNYLNDGVVWHPHWVVLEENNTVPGGLAVRATHSGSILPPTNPKMPMYMDSPGFEVTTSGNRISCAVPLYRMNNQDQFNYDGVSALMKVNTTDSKKPMLGVYEVFSVASGNLSLPFEVGQHSCDTLFLSVSTNSGRGLIDPETMKIYPNPVKTELHIELNGMLKNAGYTLEINQMNGALVHTSLLDQELVTISVADIGKQGLYLIQVKDVVTGKLMGSKKLVLQ